MIPCPGLFCSKAAFSSVYKSPSQYCETLKYPVRRNISIEREAKSFNLITGLSDHNLTMTARNAAVTHTNVFTNASAYILRQTEYISEVTCLMWVDG